MPAFFSLLLLSMASQEVGPGQPPTYAFAFDSTLVPSTPVSSHVILDDHRLVGRGGSFVWHIDATSRKLVRSDPKDAARAGRWSPGRAWLLPREVDVEALGAGFIGVAPWGAGGAWVAHGAKRAVWRLANGTWEGPWPVADEVSDCVALGENELLLQTPGHPQHTFAVIAPGGGVLRRFGARRESAFAALDGTENTWRLGLSADGATLYAAHRYRALLRIYRRNGDLVREVGIDSPHGRELDMAQIERLRNAIRDPRSGCVSCQLMQVSSAVEVTETGRVLIRFGRERAVEYLSSDGEWIQTVPVSPNRGGQDWVSAGMVVLGDLLLAWEPDGLVSYRWRKVVTPAVLRVVGSDQRPIAGAQLDVIFGGGTRQNVTSDENGRATIPAPPKGADVSVRITATSFRLLERTGVSPGVFADPFVLQRADELCVAVVSRAARNAVSRFELGVQRPTEGVGRAGVELAPTLKIESDSGRGCVLSVWDYPVTLVVRADGFATKELGLVNRPESEIAVELEPAAVVRIAVADGLGKGVPDAKVILWNATVADNPEKVTTADNMATTNESGEATVSRLRAGRYRASVRCPLFLDWEADWELGEGETTKNIVLERGANVIFRVTDRRSGVGVSDARVELTGNTPEDRRLECETAADGHCEIRSVAPGTFRASVSASGRAKTSKAVTIPEKQAEVHVELPTARGLLLNGRVAGCDWYFDQSLVVRVGLPGFVVRQAPVGPECRFRLEDVPGGPSNVWVRELGSDGSLLYQRVDLPEDREAEDLELQLPRPVVLQGLVRQGGIGCFQCRVLAELGSADVVPPRVARVTNGSGAFQAKLPRPGTWRIRIWNRQGELGWDEAIDLSSDSEQTFDLGSGVVSGQVLDVDRSPLNAATVSAFSATGGPEMRRTTTSAGGRFRLERLPSGAVRILGSRDGASAQVEIEVGTGSEQQIELILEPRKELVVRVRDSDSQAPVRSATFGVEGRTTGFRVVNLVSDPSGSFRLPVEPTDVMSLVVGAPGFAVTTVRDIGPAGRSVEVRVTPRHRSFTLELKPEAGPPCSIALLDQSGLPIALRADAPPGPLPLQTRSAMLNLLPPGAYSLVVKPCDGAAIVRPLVLATGSVPHVILP